MATCCQRSFWGLGLPEPPEEKLNFLKDNVDTNFMATCCRRIKVSGTSQEPAEPAWNSTLLITNCIELRIQLSHLQALARFRYANIVPKCFFVFMIEKSFFCKAVALLWINAILVI